MGDVRQEPSMEEILSSIKRIIAEDSEAALSPPRGRRVPRVPEPEIDEDDILELTSPVSPPRAAEPAARDSAPRRQPEAGARMPASEEDVAEAFEPLVSHVTAEASRQALAALSSVVAKPAHDDTSTLEGLVRDMLRPMLKEWLDANLPGIVETLVAREIARLTGREG